MGFRLLFAVLSVSFVWGQAADPIVLQTSTILDGKGGIQKNQQIVIEGSRIREIRPGKSRPTYDLRGLTLMPGWIDAHVHLTWHFDANHKLVNNDKDPKNGGVVRGGECVDHLAGRIHHRAERRRADR